MANYTKNTNFTAKDALSTGDPLKKILGSLFDSEFDEIATFIATKAETATSVLAGTGLTGGGTLAADRTISLGAAAIASLALADTALQTNGAIGSTATTGGILVGYRYVPRRTSGFANGEMLAVSAGQTINTSDMAAGYTFSIYNYSASNITITQGSGVTLRLAGTTTTGNRTLLARGIMTLWCNSGTECIASGNVT